MAKIRGKNWQVMIGSTPTAIGSVRDSTLTVAGTEIDVSDHDSGAWGETMTGNFNWTLTANGWFNPSSDDTTQQKALRTAAIAGTELDVVIRPDGTGTGKTNFAGKARVTQFDMGAPTDGAISFNVTFKGVGELAETDQAAT